MSGLHDVAAALVAANKGVLAADESVATMSKRLESVGVSPNADTRRDYRELLLTTPKLGEWISGVIFSDETFGQQLTDGTGFPDAAIAAGLLPGIKVDKGTTPLAFSDGGMITEGLDGLRGRVESYRQRGAVFAKWRAVLPPVGLSWRTLQANAHVLGHYAALCQETGVVPIVEPEVIMDGNHGIAMCQAVTANVLDAVFTALDRAGADPRAIVLKPNMVVAGTAHAAQAGPHEVARRTLQVLVPTVPTTVPGIAFLSGGQSNDQACANLQAINEQAADEPHARWRLTFSFGRALVDDALRTWHGRPENVPAAQEALAENCRRASEAGWASDAVAVAG